MAATGTSPSSTRIAATQVEPSQERRGLRAGVDVGGQRRLELERGRARGRRR